MDILTPHSHSCYRLPPELKVIQKQRKKPFKIMCYILICASTFPPEFLPFIMNAIGGNLDPQWHQMVASFPGLLSRQLFTEQSIVRVGGENKRKHPRSFKYWQDAAERDLCSLHPKMCPIIVRVLIDWIYSLNLSSTWLPIPPKPSLSYKDIFQNFCHEFPTKFFTAPHC